MKSLRILVFASFFIGFFCVQSQSNLAIVIPFTLEGNHLFIKANVNGSENLDFIFDTGLTVTTMNVKTAERLSLSNDKIIQTGGASGKFNAQLSKNNKLNLGAIQLAKVNLEKVSLLHLERKIGRNIDGLIGFALLKKFVVTVNYNKSQLELYPNKSFKYEGDGQVFDLITGKLSFIKAQISIDEGKWISGQFVLDTGAGLDLVLATPFSTENQVAKKMGDTYSVEAASYGEKKSTIDVAWLNKFKIKNFTFNKVPTSIFRTPTGLFSSKQIAGVIGNGLLKRFNITFDYKRKKSYWEVNDNYYNVPFTVSCSGLELSLDKTKKKVIIEKIIPESVGYESELKVGDEILEIDGIKVKLSSLFQLRKLLNQNGKEIKIKYKRYDELNELRLELKALI